MKLMELQKITDNNLSAKQIRIAVISNITFEPYFQSLINMAFLDIHASVRVIPVDYSEFLSGTFNEADDVDIAVVIPNYSNLYQAILHKDLNSNQIQEILSKEAADMQQICSVLHSKSLPLILWFGYEDYCVNLTHITGNTPVCDGLADQLNLQLLGRTEKDIVYIDTKRLIANVGIRNAYDNKNKYRWNSPYSQAMIEQICNEIYKQYLIAHGITKKCLVLDCDNVLWG